MNTYPSIHMKKYQSESPYFRYEKNRIYQVNAGVGMPIYTHQMRKMIEQLDVMESYHRKVLVVVFNLHLNAYSPDNEIITQFLRKLRYWLPKHYGIKRLGYAWCRERNKAAAQHYHVVLMLDGSKVQHPSRLLEMLKEYWQAITFAEEMNKYGHLHVPDNCFFMLKRGDEDLKAEIIYRMSYNAKTYTKQSREGLTNDYGTSQLKPKQHVT
ncbi:YagK/YfjJ domain-containing protein [Vibrio furnissii]|uniref:YagK/YfjJ domain-containing protein n=1 Tax=Vibrio furnissii TaxID=29494 RepID=UPI003AA89DD8